VHAVSCTRVRRPGWQPVEGVRSDRWPVASQDRWPHGCARPDPSRCRDRSPGGNAAQRFGYYPLFSESVMR